MGNRKSTCLYLNARVVETAKRIGLNVSVVSENALEEAINLLKGPRRGTGLASQIGSEGRGRDLNPGARLHRHGGQGSEELIAGFFDFCKVDLGLAEATSKEYRRKLRRFFRAVKKPARDITAEDVRRFLKPLSAGNANTWGNMLKPLKRFFRDYMQMPETVESFRFRKAPLKPLTVPSKGDLRRFYGKLRTPIARALFLMYAATGLRRTELLSLRKEDVDWERRMIVPQNHTGGTKRSWVTFFNEEAEKALKGYLATRKDGSPKLFRMSSHRFIDAWRHASRDSGVRVTPQVLRGWFCDEMGKLGVPDRYVDAFCGRTPNSILAKHYSDFSPEKLQDTYEHTRLRIIS